MDGKTFLAAFQVGSRLYPDEVDRRISRGKIDLEKNLLRIKQEAETAAKEREKTGLKEFNEFKQGFEKLDLNNVNFLRSGRIWFLSISLAYQCHPHQRLCMTI